MGTCNISIFCLDVSFISVYLTTINIILRCGCTCIWLKILNIFLYTHSLIGQLTALCNVMKLNGMHTSYKKMKPYLLKDAKNTIVQSRHINKSVFY